MQAMAQAAGVRGAAVSGAVAAIAAEGSRQTVSRVSAVKAGFMAGSEVKVNAVREKMPVVSRRAGQKGVVSMKANTAAVGYAAALVELGKATGKLDAIHSDVEALGSLIEMKELADYLANPTVADEKKKAILKTVATDGKYSVHTTNFLNLLVDKRRINILQQITVVFEELYCETTDTQVAVVTSAVKLENSQQALIAKKLQSMTGAKNIKLKNIVDPALIAGFIVKYGKDGSSEVDMSVKGQLDRLAAQFEYAQQNPAAA